jgi:multiple sugar transport system substrate-binding protein/sn-glycerol 3-phosphate transport system substrate-binding protein
MLGEAPAEGEDLLDEVMAAGKLVVSSDPNYAPQSFLNESGELDGFDVDVSKEVAKRLGVDIAFETPDWDLVVAGGWGGRWDISIGSMTPTVPRSEVLWFTDAYYYTPASLAVHKDNTDITTVEDLEGRKLGFGTATTYEDWLNGALDIMEGYGGGVFYDPPSSVDQNPYNTDSEAIQDLALGDGVRLDAVMSAAPTIQSAIDEGLPLKFVGTPAFFEPLVFALDKGRGPSEKMVAKLNEILADMHADGTLTDLSLEWYGVDITQVVEPGEASAPEPEMAECELATVGPLAGVDPRGVTIDWWHNHSGSREEQLLPLVDRFNSTNPCGITVNPTNQGSYDDIRDKMNASIATGDLPGLVVGYQNDQAFYQLADGLADLNIYVDDPTWGLGAEKEDFYAGFLQQSVHPAYNNQRLGFPPNRSMLMLYYNQTWLEELGYDGPPTTPDEFKEMSCAAAEANGDGTGGYILYLSASGVAGWTYAFGGDVLSDDGLGYVYNGPATVEAMTMLKEMYDEGCAYLFTEGYPDPEFGARRAIFVTESSSSLPFVQSAIDTFAEETGREPDEWGVAAIPHTTDVPVQNVYGGDVMIPATTPEEQLAAWIFIKWYTSPEIQAEWVKISGYFPTRRATTDYLGDYVNENKQFGTALSLLPYGYFEPQLISYQSVRDASEQAANAIIQGADIQSTLDDLTDEANELQAELMEE